MKAYKEERESSRCLSYTIAPTLSCNFRCPYCYEEGHRYNTMTHECARRLVEFINQKIDEGKERSLQIAWYGGEPLLAMHLIDGITKGINREGIQYAASIVTNGYYLSRENAVRLKELEVKHAQVTIDGPPDIHNKRRCLPSGEDTFFRILDNIRIACEHISISVRVNIDRDNAARADELFDDYGLRGKVSLYIAAVTNTNGTCAGETCLADREFSDYEAEFIRKHLRSGYIFAHLPGFNPGICGAVNKGAAVVDPLGDLYKCWNEIGRKDQSFGSIFENAENENALKWNQYDFIYYEECRECRFLPVCMGGCPHENLVEKRKTCISVKNNYKEMIGLVRDYKALGRKCAGIQG